MNEIRCWLHVYLAVVVIFCYIPILGGAVESCDVGHAFLLTNDTTGVTISYTNTHDCDANSVTFVGRFLPSQLICGERNDRCGMSSMSNSNGSILVIAFPLDGGLGLVSYQFENSSYFFREKQFVTQSIADCTLAFFIPYPLRRNEFFGYCLDLSGHMIRHIIVEIGFERLANSRVYLDSFYQDYAIQSNSFLSNFLYILNIPVCFSTDNGHVVFLYNDNLEDLGLDDERYSQYGNIGVPGCSVSEPRLQRLGSECMLAAYCNGTTAVFGTLEHFPGSVQVIATESDELAFVCSSLNYILFRNKTLSVRELSSGNQIGNSFPFDTESILLGDCLVSQQQFFFVAALSNNSKFFVNFSARSSYSLAESGNYTTPTPYLVQDKLLFVNNGTSTLIQNWTRMSEENILSLPINFDLVLSFSSGTTSEQCGCISEGLNATTTMTTTMTTTEVVSEDSTTTPVPAGHTTFATSTPEPVLTSGEIIGFGIGIGVGVPVFAGFVLLAIAVVCLICKFKKSRHQQYNPSNQLELNIVNPSKEDLEKLNFINNDDYLEAKNNNEPNQQGPPPSTRPEEGGQTTNAEVHQEEETSFNNMAQNKGKESVKDNNTNFLTTDAEVHQEEEASNNNSNFLTTDAEVHQEEETSNNNSNSLTTDAEVHQEEETSNNNSNSLPITVRPQPVSETNTRPNNDAVVVVNRPTRIGIAISSHNPSSNSIEGSEINTVHEDATDTDHDPNKTDLVTPSTRHPVRPRAEAVEHHSTLIEERHGQRYDNGGPSNEQ